MQYESRLWGEKVDVEALIVAEGCSFEVDEGERENWRAEPTR
jgi:hypothetical protein